MFKYNELSDLLDGTLVTPLSKEDNGTIRCTDSDGNECYYEFDDFDFDITEEERVERTSSLEDQTKEIENSTTTVDEIIKAMTDDADYDGSEDEEEAAEETSDEDKEEDKEGFVKNPELLKKLGLSKGIFYKDIIS